MIEEGVVKIEQDSPRHLAGAAVFAAALGLAAFEASRGSKSELPPVGGPALRGPALVLDRGRGLAGGVRHRLLFAHEEPGRVEEIEQSFVRVPQLLIVGRTRQLLAQGVRGGDDVRTLPALKGWRAIHS